MTQINIRCKNPLMTLGENSNTERITLHNLSRTNGPLIKIDMCRATFYLGDYGGATMVMEFDTNSKSFRKHWDGRYAKDDIEFHTMYKWKNEQYRDDMAQTRRALDLEITR